MIRSIALIAALVAASAANASVVVNTIDMEVRNSNYTVTGSESATGLLNEFNSGSLVCSQSLTTLSNAGSRQSCSGPIRNIATRFDIKFTMDAGADVIFEMGPDYGRGAAVLVGESATTLTGDYWWGYNWGRTSEIITFTAENTTGSDLQGLVTFLGFEGCCGGGMSLRYSTDGGSTWNIATAVPAPATLVLFGLGLMGAAFGRRKLA